MSSRAVAEFPVLHGILLESPNSLLMCVRKGASLVMGYIVIEQVKWTVGCGLMAKYESIGSALLSLHPLLKPIHYTVYWHNKITRTVKMNVYG